MLTIFIALLGIIITILVVVGIHEFGHFIVARLCGIKVLRFSLGFGKSLYRWHDKKGTEYVIAAIPLGGYVKMLDENEGEVPAKERHLAYNNQSLSKRAAVVIAGPLFNILFSAFIYWVLFVVGVTTVRPVIGTITPHSIAAEAGLKPQQEILQIDNQPVSSWYGVVIKMLLRTGDNNSMQLQTQSLNSTKKQNYTLNLSSWHMDELKPDPLSSLGIVPYQAKKPSELLLRKNKYNFYQAIPHAYAQTRDFVKLNVIFIGKMLVGKVSIKSLGGPITIFASAGTALNHGLIPFMSFIAFLSIAVGVINIVPIPGLDGGHLLFQGIELIMRRPLSQRVQLLFYKLGIILLLLLIVQALANDLMRL